jgi:hypothetical protein
MPKKYVIYQTKWLATGGRPEYVEVAVPSPTRGESEVSAVLAAAKEVVAQRYPGEDPRKMALSAVIPLYGQPIYVLSEEELE